MKNEKKHETGEGKMQRRREREMKNYKSGSSKKMTPCNYKKKGKK